MLGHNHIGFFDHLARERPFQKRFHAAGAQARKNIYCNLAQHFRRRLTGQTLHVRIEDFVTKLAVVNYDAFASILNNGFIELHGVAKRSFTGFLCRHIARQSQNSLWPTGTVEYRAYNYVKPAGLMCNSGFEITGETADLAPPG